MTSPIARRSLLCFIAIIALIVLFDGYAASIDHSTITEVVNDVTVLTPQSHAGSPAKTSAVFRAPEIMKTGPESRSEMVAEDQTITRVGADTLFSFEPKERAINLKQGSLLFQSPKGKGGGSIRTAAATASVLGTTIVVVATKDGGFKLLVLEGTGLVVMPNGKKRVLHGGEMVFIRPGAHDPGSVLIFRLEDEVDTALLVSGFKRHLPSWEKILKEIVKQNSEIASGKLQLPGIVLGGIADPNHRINQTLGLHLGGTPAPVPTPQSTLQPTPQPTPPPPRSRPTGSPIR